MTYNEHGVPILTPDEVSRIKVNYGSPEANERHAKAVDEVMRRIKAGEIGPFAKRTEPVNHKLQ